MTDANAQLQRKAGPRSGPELYNGRRRQRTSSRAAIKAQVTGNYSYTTSWDTTALLALLRLSDEPSVSATQARIGSRLLNEKRVAILRADPEGRERQAGCS